MLRNAAALARSVSRSTGLARACWIRIDDGAHSLERSVLVGNQRVLSGEQDVKQHAECIHVGRTRYFAALKLFGSRILWRESLPRHLREAGYRCGGPVVEQLRDAEVDELHLALGCYEDVRRFQVPMQDQLGMRVRDRGEYVLEQSHARFQIERPTLAPAADRFTLDVIQHQIGLTHLGNTGIDESCDVRVGQATEGVAFTPKAFDAAGTEEREIEQLDGNACFVPSVTAMSKPDRAHAALPQQPIERVTADNLAGEARFWRRSRYRAFQEVLALDLCLLSQERSQIIRQRAVVASELRDPIRLRGGIERQ